MPARRDSRRMAMLDRGNALEIALQRHARIRAALEVAKAQGFDMRRLRADLVAIEAEIRQLQQTRTP